MINRSTCQKFITVAFQRVLASNYAAYQATQYKAKDGLYSHPVRAIHNLHLFQCLHQFTIDLIDVEADHIQVFQSIRNFLMRFDDIRL